MIIVLNIIITGMSLLQKHKTAGVWYSCIHIFTRYNQ